MAQTSVRVRTVQDACVAVGWAGHRTLTVDRPEQAGGMGLGFNGGELLLLAIGGCYCNDIYREAAKLGMVIKSVQGDAIHGPKLILPTWSLPCDWLTVEVIVDVRPDG